MAVGAVFAVLVPASLAGSAVAATTARSVLVYTCGPSFENLCQIRPDSGRRQQLTSNGRSAPSARYAAPSLSRSGTKLAYLLGSKLFVLDRASGRKTRAISSQAELARISPDGTRVGDLENFSSVNSLAVCVFNITGSGRDCVGATGSFGFTNDNRVLASVSAGSEYNYDKGICLLAMDGSGCERYIVADAAHDLWDPAISPNGKLLAVTRAAPSQVVGAIMVYDYATGALVRQLTNGPSDSTPVWSPDGSQLAFVRPSSGGSSSIYAVSVNGRPGSARRLVARGRDATWGAAVR